MDSGIYFEPKNEYLYFFFGLTLNPLNAELNPICHLLALLGAHRILHISRIRVKLEYLGVYASGYIR